MPESIGNALKDRTQGKSLTFEAFDDLFEELIKECRNMRDTKGKEYANNNADRLANFKRLASRNGATPLQVWHSFFGKHLDSIESYVKNERTFSTESIRSRFVDLITYAVLGYGLIVDSEEPVTIKARVDYTSPDTSQEFFCACGYSAYYLSTVLDHIESAHPDWMAIKECQKV